MNVASAVYAVMFGAHFAATAVSLRSRDPWFTGRRRRLSALTAVTGMVLSLRDGYWAAAVFCAATVVLLLSDWWRRDGRRTARALGARSLAVLAAVVAKAREAGSSPVPEGVGA